MRAEGVKALDAPRGFEPRLAESESAVLPLDDGAIASARICRCPCFVNVSDDRVSPISGFGAKETDSEDRGV